MPLFLATYWKQLAIAAAVVIALSTSYFAGYNYRAKICEADSAKAVQQWQDEINKERERKDEISAKLQEALQAKDILDKQLAKKVTNEINNNRVYTECVVPSTGVQLNNSTARQYNQARGSK